MKKIIAFLTSFVLSFSLPLSAFAATVPLQKTLDEAINKFSDNTIVHSTTTKLDVTMSSRELNKKGKKSSLSLKTTVDTDSLPTEEGTFATQGTVSLDQLAVETDGFSFSSNDVISIDEKLVGGTAYFALNRVSNEVKEALANFGVADLSKIIGMWVRFEIPKNSEDLSASASSLNSLTGVSSRFFSEGDQEQLLKEMKGIKSYFLVRKVLSKTKNESGSFTKAEVVINPKLINVVRKILTKRQSGETKKEYTARMKETTKSLQRVQGFLAKTKFIVMIDESSASIKRYEIHTNYTFRDQTDTYNYKTGKIVKTPISYSVVFNLGTDFNEPRATAITPPVQSVTPEEFMGMLMPETLTEELPINENQIKDLSGENDGTKDSDGDGLFDVQEIYLGTDPTKADTDSDGLTDGAEVNVWKTNPLKADTDGDGLTDGAEVKNGDNALGTGKLFE